MKFGMKAIILGSVLLLLLISVAIQGYIMITISGKKEYAIEQKPGTTDKIVTTEGVSAPTFWKDTWHIFIGPAIIDLIAMGLLATLYVMT